MPAPNLGPQYDLAARLSALEDQMRRLQQNPLGQAFSATQSDGSVGMQIYQDPTTGSTAMVFYQGPTTARDPNTGLHPVLTYFGELFSGGVAVDSGMIFNRPTGTQTAVIGNRGMQVYDTKHNRVFGTDEYAASPTGEGLTEPGIPIPLPVATGVTSWPKTTTSGLIAESVFRGHNPKVFYTGFGYADAGTSGTVQVTISNSGGTVVATGTSYTVSNTVLPFAETIALPTGFYGQSFTLQVNATASGGGNVYAQLVGANGTGS